MRFAFGLNSKNALEQYPLEYQRLQRPQDHFRYIERRRNLATANRVCRIIYDTTRQFVVPTPNLHRFLSATAVPCRRNSRSAMKPPPASFGPSPGSGRVPALPHPRHAL